jgi:hypothetical protein
MTVLKRAEAMFQSSCAQRVISEALWLCVEKTMECDYNIVDPP